MTGSGARPIPDPQRLARRGDSARRQGLYPLLPQGLFDDIMAMPLIICMVKVLGHRSCHVDGAMRKCGKYNGLRSSGWKNTLLSIWRQAARRVQGRRPEAS